MKKIDQFVNQYSLQKTLRFKLIPEGKTLENFIAARILEDDEVRAENYEKVKEYLDRYYRDFINSVLTETCIEGVEEYSELYYRQNKSDDDRKKMADKEDNLRKQVANALKRDERYKLLFKREILREILPTYLSDPEELEIAASFKDFSTYFSGFFKNRENMFTDEEKSTGIAFRCINDNLPRFLDNARIFPKIVETLKDKWGDINATYSGLTGMDVLDLFSVDHYSFVLSQDGIDMYNQVIGGYTNTDKSEVKGLNVYINHHNQTAKREGKLPKLKILHKQILSEGSTFSYIPEKFENDDEVIFSINNYLAADGEKKSFAETISDLEKLLRQIPEMDGSGIFVKNNSDLTNVSQSVFGRWDAVRSAWEEEYDKSNRHQNTEEYFDKRQKAFKAIPSFSLADIDRLGTQKCEEAYAESNVTEWLINEFTNRVEAYRQARAAAEALLNGAHTGEKRLPQDGEAIEQIKNLLDSVKKIESLAATLLGTGKEEKTEEFYGEFLPFYERLEQVDRLYDCVRNYMTQKPFKTDKIKLTFNCSYFLNGWSQDYSSKSALIFRNGSNYYIGIVAANSLGKYEMDYLYADTDESQAEQIKYNFQKPDNKNTPRLFIRSKGTNYAPAVREYDLPIEDIIDIYDNGYFKTEYRKIDPEAYRAALVKMIDYFKLGFLRHESYKQFNFAWKESADYNDISAFYKDVLTSCYQLVPAKINFDHLMSLVNEGRLYLFRVYNKDFSENSHGTPNLHTSFFRALFDGKNLEKVVFKLNGESEMFYRKASIGGKEKTVHPANEPIKNKNEKNPKHSSTFGYDLIKDKRYTEDQFMIHIPITCNFSAPDRTNINEAVRREIKNCEHNCVIGIDRGERNLLYICVLDEQGNIKGQFSLNEIVNELKGVPRAVDYHALLDKKENERMDARKNWTAVENIRELKEGYLSQVIHKICELVEEHDAVIAMEDLNFGFKSGRMKVEKSVYQKFEKMLTDKLNFYVNKKYELDRPGGLLNAYQLTNKYEAKSKGKQNGFIFYIPAWLTSKIDPVTGFVDLLYPRYESVAASKAFFEKFDRIGYSEENGWFEFEFDYGNFSGGVTDYRRRWTVCSYGERIHTFRSPQKNNGFDSETVNLTEDFNKLFAEYGIRLSADMKQDILVQNDRDFFYRLTACLKLLLQMRNSISGTDVDYLISPVRGEDGSFYCSNDYDKETSPLPIDADANGAYNIARKAHMLIARMKETPDDKLMKMNMAISKAEWLEYAQK